MVVKMAEMSVGVMGVGMVYWWVGLMGSNEVVWKVE